MAKEVGCGTHCLGWARVEILACLPVPFLFKATFVTLQGFAETQSGRALQLGKEHCNVTGYFFG